MAAYKAIYLFFLILSPLLVNCELTTENVVGGSPASVTDYPYQVGIIGKHNKTNTHFLVCSGAILNDFFIISDSECFMDGQGELVKLRFFVVLSSDNLKYNYRAAQEVVFIYAYFDSFRNTVNYIALLQLADSLNLNFRKYLGKVYLPRKGEDYGMQGKVAGYGFQAVGERAEKAITGRPRVCDSSNHPLTYVDVDITTDQDCRCSYPFIYSEKSFCGKIKRQPDLPVRGICWYDEGAPFVIGDIVVGIAQKNRKDCDNTVHGNIYTRVSFHLDFIYGVLFANHTKGTIVQYNRLQYT